MDLQTEVKNLEGKVVAQEKKVMGEVKSWFEHVKSLFSGPVKFVVSLNFKNLYTLGTLLMFVLGVFFTCRGLLDVGLPLLVIPTAVALFSHAVSVGS